MADNDHKSIPTAQRHNPKGFEDAANNTQLTKDSSGNIAWEVGSSGGLVTTTINIGDWDMSALATITVAHGLSATEYKTIRLAEVIIRDDTDVYYNPITSFSSLGGTGRGGIDFIDATNFDLRIVGGGTGYQNTSYDSTSYNRGWITFSYTPD